MNLVIVIILGLLISSTRKQKKIGIENSNPKSHKVALAVVQIILDYLSDQHANILGRITKSIFF